MIHERVVRDSVWLQMTSKDDKTRTCSYSKLSGFGHTIYGKRLTYKDILPNKCAVIKNIKSFRLHQCLYYTYCKIHGKSHHLDCQK